MSDKSINIIVMRDQSKSFTLGFSAQTFRIIIGALVLIPLLLIASIWFGLTYYNKYVIALEESVQLKKNIEQNRQTVTRLANLERFLQKYSPDMLGILVPTEEIDINNLPVLGWDKQILMSELAQNLAGEQMSFDVLAEKNKEQTQVPEKNQEKQAEQENNTEKTANTVDSNQEQPVNENKQEEKQLTAENTVQQKTIPETTETAAQQAASDTVGQGNETLDTSENEQDKAGTASENASLPNGSDHSKETLLQKVDLGYVSIENALAKVSAQNIIATFRLKNNGKKNPIQGNVKFYIYSEIDGKFAIQELANATDTNFKIRNLKNVKSSASIMGIKTGNKAQFIIEIQIDDSIVYRQLYPLLR